MVLPSTSSVAIGSRNVQFDLPSVPTLHSYTCAPSACTVSTMVSPGAAMASGRGVSAEAALTSEPDSNSKASAVFLTSGIVCPFGSIFKNTNPMRGRLCRHRLGQVFRDLVEEAGGGQPALVGADQKRKVLGHEAGFHGIDADFLQRQREFRQCVVVVELGAMREPAGPGEDRGDRVGRGLLAFLILAVMPRD